MSVLVEIHNCSLQNGLPILVRAPVSRGLDWRGRTSRASPKYTTPSSPRVWGWVTVTHPSHPLCCQQVEIIRVRRGPDPDLIMRHLDGYHGAIAASWTTYASTPESVASEPPPLLDLEGLSQLARVIEQLQERHRLSGKKPL